MSNYFLDQDDQKIQLSNTVDEKAKINKQYIKMMRPHTQIYKDSITDLQSQLNEFDNGIQEYRDYRTLPASKQQIKRVLSETYKFTQYPENPQLSSQTNLRTGYLHVDNLYKDPNKKLPSTRAEIMEMALSNKIIQKEQRKVVRADDLKKKRAIIQTIQQKINLEDQKKKKVSQHQPKTVQKNNYIGSFTLNMIADLRNKFFNELVSQDADEKFKRIKEIQDDYIPKQVNSYKKGIMADQKDKLKHDLLSKKSQFNSYYQLLALEKSMRKLVALKLKPEIKSYSRFTGAENYKDYRGIESNRLEEEKGFRLFLLDYEQKNGDINLLDENDLQLVQEKWEKQNSTMKLVWQMRQEDQEWEEEKAERLEKNRIKHEEEMAQFQVELSDEKSSKTPKQKQIMKNQDGNQVQSKRFNTSLTITEEYIQQLLEKFRGNRLQMEEIQEKIDKQILEEDEELEKSLNEMVSQKVTTKDSISSSKKKEMAEIKSQNEIDEYIKKDQERLEEVKAKFKKEREERMQFREEMAAWHKEFDVKPNEQDMLNKAQGQKAKTKRGRGIIKAEEDEIVDQAEVQIKATKGRGRGRGIGHKAVEQDVANQAEEQRQEPKGRGRGKGRCRGVVSKTEEDEIVNQQVQLEAPKARGRGRGIVKNVEEDEIQNQFEEQFEKPKGRGRGIGNKTEEQEKENNAEEQLEKPKGRGRGRGRGQYKSQNEK